MKKQSNPVFQFIMVAILSGLMLVASAKMFKKDIGLDLNETTKVEGIITRSFDTLHNSGGKLKHLPVFAFNLNNVQQTLAAYCPSHDYSKLRKDLQPGEAVSVYYRPSLSRDLNIDVFQIEKNNEVVLDYNSYDQNHRFTAIMLATIGIVMFALALRQFIFKRKRSSKGDPKTIDHITR